MTLTDDIVALLDRDLAEPHRILGAHPVDGGVVIRAFRPDADGVTAKIEGGTTSSWSASTTPGCSRARWPARRCRCATCWRCATRTGTFTLRDPYAFLPSLGELDIHLLGEGRHEELYEKLGAHVRELDGVAGTAFAVWAPPRARSASSATSTPGTGACTRCARSGSGIWELFVPDVGEGQRYKYEIRTPDGELSLKADPLAFETEVPPRTASVVHRAAPRLGRRRVDGRARAQPTRSRSRSRSTRCTSAPGGSTRSRATGR